MRNQLFSWDDLFDRALDKSCLDDELKAKDEARACVGEFALSHGLPDPEKTECPEDAIANICRDHRLLFDTRGALVCTEN